MPATKTLSQKFDALHSAEDAVRAALADLADAGTGESIAPGALAFDPASGSLFTNEGGRIVRKRVQIVATAGGRS
jgi:hypothetical protein